MGDKNKASNLVKRVSENDFDVTSSGFKWYSRREESMQDTFWEKLTESAM